MDAHLLMQIAAAWILGGIAALGIESRGYELKFPKWSVIKTLGISIVFGLVGFFVGGIAGVLYIGISYHYDVETPSPDAVLKAFAFAGCLMASFASSWFALMKYAEHWSKNEVKKA